MNLHFLKILNKHFKLKYFFVLVSLFLIGFVELVSIGSVPVYVMILVEKDIILPYLPTYLQSKIQEKTFSELILFSSYILILIFFIKNAVLYFINLFHIHFQQDLRSFLSKEIYQKYLLSDYAKFLNFNSANLIRGIVNDTGITALYFKEFATLISEIITISFVLILIIFTSELQIVLLLFSLIVVVFSFYFYFRKILKIKGEESHKFRGELIKVVTYSFNGFREIRILKKFNFVKNIFNSKLLGEINNSTFQKKINLLPKYILEIVCISGVLIIIYTMSDSKQMLIISLPTLSLYLAAVIRFIPSFNRIVSVANKLKYDAPVILDVLEKFKLSNNFKKIELNENSKKINHSIIFKDISFFYDNRDKPAFNNLNLEIIKNKTHMIYGESGSGKSTFIDIFTGLLNITSGSIIVDGNKVKYLNSYVNSIGYVPQEIFLFDGTLRENIAFGVEKNKINDEKIKDALKASNLLEFFEKIPNYMDINLGDNGVKISGGQKQRIAIARALYINSEFIIFDEPTSSLDEKNEEEILETILKLKFKKTVVVVTHKTKFKNKFDHTFNFKK